jgi:ABC-type lipopolysaccharide export system ATPase subunit
MKRLPDPKQKIPERLKSDNWAFHAMARSDDPAYKCQNIGNLVNNLVATLAIAELLDTEINHTITITKKVKDTVQEKTRFFRTLDEFMKFQVIGANLSWNLYSRGERGEAVEVAAAVLREVLFLVYDERFTTVDEKTSFYGRGVKV